jgi:hypothetical protein
MTTSTQGGINACNQPFLSLAATALKLIPRHSDLISYLLLIQQLMSVTLGCASAKFVGCGKIKMQFWRWRLWLQEIQTRLLWHLWRGLAKYKLAGIWSQAVSSVLVGLTGISVAVKMFSHLIYFMNTFYKWCALNTICKDKDKYWGWQSSGI